MTAEPTPATKILLQRIGIKNISIVIVVLMPIVFAIIYAVLSLFSEQFVIALFVVSMFALGPLTFSEVIFLLNNRKVSNEILLTLFSAISASFICVHIIGYLPVISIWLVMFFVFIFFGIQDSLLGKKVNEE